MTNQLLRIFLFFYPKDSVCILIKNYFLWQFTLILRAAKSPSTIKETDHLLRIFIHFFILTFNRKDSFCILIKIPFFWNLFWFFYQLIISRNFLLSGEKLCNFITEVLNKMKNFKSLKNVIIAFRWNMYHLRGPVLL